MLVSCIGRTGRYDAPVSATDNRPIVLVLSAAVVVYYSNDNVIFLIKAFTTIFDLICGKLLDCLKKKLCLYFTHLHKFANVHSPLPSSSAM